jgi:hypothetical protein
VVIDAVRHADPSRVLDDETKRLDALRYPPFGGLAQLTGAPDAVRAAADAARVAGARVLGPRAQGEKLDALVAHESPAQLADVLAAVVPDARALGRLRVEVDPLRI